MTNRADSIRVVHPLFQAEGGGSIPTSALQLWFEGIDFKTAKRLNRLWHSRFPGFGGGGYRATHSAQFDGLYYAVAIWTNPSAAKLPQLSWLMLKRWAIADDAPPNTASRMMMWMVRDIRKRLPEVEMLVSYSDPDTHDGAIYKASGWTEGDTTKRTPGSKQWHNRERVRVSENQACEWVTRWTRRLKGNPDERADETGVGQAGSSGTEAGLPLPQRRKGGTGKRDAPSGPSLWDTSTDDG
jgi:hypothetical protein